MTNFIQFRSTYSSSLVVETIPTESCSDEEVLKLKLASRNPKKRAGRKKFKETRHPVYRGVRLRDSGKWVCEIREPNKKTRIWLGTYPTADMAARAHDVAVLAMKGRSACLNFADSVWRLPVPDSSSVKDIQKAAVKAAEAFRPVVMEMEERKELPRNNVFCFDEEVFEMPWFLADMAEGMMLSPPRSFQYDKFEDDVEFCVDESLWNF